MSRLPIRYNFGSELKNENPTLYNQLADIYYLISNAVNSKVNKYVTTTDPTTPNVINRLFDIGDIWVNETTDTGFLMTSRTSDIDATWTQIT